MLLITVTAIVILSLAIILLNNIKIAFLSNQPGHNSNNPNEIEQPVFYGSLQTFLFSIGIVTLVMAIKRVLDKKSRDFRPSNKIEQITEEEYKY